eukprot:SAG31_NODE_4775_length_2962_cov_26.328676_1_plen_201_part_10
MRSCQGWNARSRHAGYGIADAYCRPCWHRDRGGAGRVRCAQPLITLLGAAAPAAPVCSRLVLLNVSAEGLSCAASAAAAPLALGSVGGWTFASRTRLATQRPSCAGRLGAAPSRVLSAVREASDDQPAANARADFVPWAAGQEHAGSSPVFLFFLLFLFLNFPCSAPVFLFFLSFSFRSYQNVRGGRHTCCQQTCWSSCLR